MKNDKIEQALTLGYHHVSNVFITHGWREHPAISGVINYHLFRFTVPFPTYLTLKEEVDGLKYQEKERQVEMSRLVARMGKFEKQ